MAEPAAKLPWETYLGQMFPAVLIPASVRHEIDADSAERFLRGLGVDADIANLAITTLVAGHIADLQRFCDELSDWVRAIPSHTLPHRRVWDNGYHGRLSIAETLAYRMAGMPTRFVTVARRRSVDIPESRLVRAVAARLLHQLEGLRQTGMLDNQDWGDAALECASRLTHITHSSALRDIPLVAVSGVELRAARAARHPCYESAIAWHNWLEDALDRRDQRRLAELLAAGALQPADVHKRFEVAVLICLIQAMADACARSAGLWHVEYSLIQSGRRDVASFRRSDGALTVRVYYDQPILPLRSGPGPRARGVEHYIYTPRGQRPDITVVMEPAGEPALAMVIEIKNSSSRSYQATGYGEALLYRHEYSEELIDWPKAVLVSSGPIRGPLSRAHEVVAVDWLRWVPDELVSVLLPST